MIARCFNPTCAAPFQYLRGGKLFVRDSGNYGKGGTGVSQRHVEHFWLCGSCARSVTLDLQARKPQVIPLTTQRRSAGSRQLSDTRR